MPQPKEEIYSDLDLAFIANPITKKLSRKVNRESIKQSVKSLILTNFFERPFKSNIGCSVTYYLFEIFTQAVKQQMENAVKEVIRNYEPRAEVVDVLVQERPDLNSITISVAFFILNDPEPIFLNVLLERVR
jgi:phage baseplate assembly protein W